MIFVIALASWTYIARIIRGQVLSLREKEFVEAAALAGRLERADHLPRDPARTWSRRSSSTSTLLIPPNILLEAALSFLGVGVQPPTASWGEMIADATPIFDTAWWYMLFPGIALLLTVLAFNLVGDGLQDALNPRTGRSRGARRERAVHSVRNKEETYEEVRSLDPLRERHGGARAVRRRLRRQ